MTKRCFAVFAIAVLVTATAACSPASGQGTEPRTPAHHGPIQPVRVSDEAFAPSLHQVLLDGSSTLERTNLLVGVVRRQLARAEARFASGHHEAGLDALTGALYLTRANELRPEMFEGAADVLRHGAREVARVGDEGRARALYNLLRKAVSTTDERREVEQHIAALERWTSATREPGTMQAVGADQRATAHQSLFETTPKVLDDARMATLVWINQSLEFSTEQAPPRSHFEREEAIEAFRARRAGGATLVALYLRHGDAAGALDAIEKGDVSRVVPPPLRERIELLADDPHPEAWWQLYQLFSRADSPELPETALDPALARAAAWGAATELYRIEPNNLRSALALAELMIRYQMPEVAPLVLHGALGNDADARDLSLALALVLRAIIDQDELGEIGAARRTFAAARPIVEMAATDGMAGRTHPTAARARYVMGAIEMRAGEPGKARPHIAEAVKTEPSAEAFMRLAAIDRQRGARDEALKSLASVRALAKAANDFHFETEASLVEYEVHRDHGDAAAAATALEASLKRALDARSLARSPVSRARAERLLARALEHYGKLEEARAATERAYDAAGSDLRQLTATVLDESRRSLTRGDVRGGQSAIKRALDMSLPAEDMIYVALWQQLLEQIAKAPGEGTTDEALDAVEPQGWPGKLRAWAENRLDGAGLLAEAQNRVERTEATFYAAMAKYAAGDWARARPLLEKVAKSEAIDLVEVTIARDLLALDASPAVPELPDSITLP